VTFLNRIRQYRVYRRLVISFFLLIVLSIAIVSTILYTLFSSRAVKEIDKSSQQMLSHVSFTANVVYKQIQDVVSQLLIDNHVNAYLYADQVDKVQNLQAYIVISKVQSVYPFIANISLYNFTNGEYIDTLGLERDPDAAAKAQKQQQKPFLGFYQRKVQKNDAENSNNQLRLLTFRIVPEWLPVKNTPRSALVLDLNESYIRDTINSINTSIPNADTFVIDASGKVISHSDPQYFMADFSGKSYVASILKKTDNQGSFVETLDHDKFLVTYVKSSTLDWFFITVRPYNELLSDIYALRTWTLVIALLLMVLGTAIAFMLTGNMYNPIRSLLDRVLESRGTELSKGSLLNSDEYTLLSNAFKTTMESAERLELNLQRSNQVLKSSSMLSLLQGIHKAALAQIEQEWAHHLKGPFFSVIVMKVDGLRRFKQSFSTFDRELIAYAIGNIAQEILSTHIETDVTVTEDEIVLIVQSANPDRNEHLFLSLTEIQDAVHAYYKITVSASIGDWCDSIDRLSNAYRSAQEYICHRLFLGSNCIVDANRVMDDRETDKRYPTLAERKLLEAVKMRHAPSIHAEVRHWIDYVSGCTYLQAIQYTNFLILAMAREFEHMTEGWGIDVQIFSMALGEIQHAETLAEIEELLTRLCRNIVNALEETRHNVSILKNEKVIDEVKQFIEQHYQNPDLSLDSVAHQVGLSAGYLGKLFKSYGKTTFNDYVTLLRIEEAKRLLGTTDGSVAEIGAGVGIPGASYFSTVFKKHVGMSPSQYRENYNESR